MPSSKPGATRLLDDDSAGSSNLGAVQAQVNQVQSCMRENVNTMVVNIEKASTLETASSELAMQAREFHKTSRVARRHFWWQLCKQRLVIGVACGLFLVVLLIIIFGSGGGGDHNDMSSPS